MPAPKTLVQHSRERTFRSRRHRELLLGPVVPWPELAALQARYAATAHELERRAIGVEFERAVARLPANDAIAATAASLLDEIVNAPPEPHTPDRDRAASERAARVLYARDAFLYGMRRIEDDAPGPLTVDEIAKRLGVCSATVRRYLAEAGVGV